MYQLEFCLLKIDQGGIAINEHDIRCCIAIDVKTPLSHVLN